MSPPRLKFAQSLVYLSKKGVTSYIGVALCLAGRGFSQRQFYADRHRKA